VFELKNKGYKLLVAHCSLAYAGMLPQLAMLVARRSFFIYSYPGLVGNTAPLPWSCCPEPRLSAPASTSSAAAALSQFRPALRALNLGRARDILASAQSVDSVSLHVVRGGAYTHKAPLRPGDNVSLGEVDKLVRIEALFTLDDDVFFVGRAWSMAAAGVVQDPARYLHSTWGLSDVAIAGRVSEILGKAWTHKQKSGFLTYAPLIERHHWW
jgi:hypothetical protein